MTSSLRPPPAQGRASSALDYPALERSSTVDAIARELTRQILSGAIPPGTWVREVEIANGFDVSRQTLRMSLQLLIHDGLLRHAPHRGVWVPHLTSEDLRDIYEVRGVLEAEAARRLAASPDKLAPLYIALDRLRAVADDAPWSMTLEAHHAFHRTLVDAAGSPRLSRVYLQLWSEAWLGLAASRGRHPDATPTGQVRTHARLLEVIEAGQPEPASREARQHMQSGLDAALEVERARGDSNR